MKKILYFLGIIILLIIIFLIWYFLANKKEDDEKIVTDNSTSVLLPSKKAMFTQMLLEKLELYLVDKELTDNYYEIDSLEILTNVDNDFSTCHGKIVINKKDYGYKIVPNVTCAENIDSFDLKYVIHKINSFEVQKQEIVGKVDNGYFTTFMIDYSESDDETYANAGLIMYDNDGNINWVSKYSDKLTDGVNKSSYIQIKEVFEINNYYVVFGNISILSSESDFYNSERLENLFIPFMASYDKNGNLINKQILNEEIIYHNALFSEVYKDGYFYLYGGNTLYKLDEKGLFISKTETDIISEYGYYTLDSFDGEYFYLYNDYAEEKFFVKMDKDGKAIFKKAPKINLPIKDFFVTYKNIFILVSDNTYSEIIVYDKDGNYIKNLNYKELFKNGTVTSINSINVNSKDVIINASTNKGILIDEISDELLLDKRWYLNYNKLKVLDNNVYNGCVGSYFGTAERNYIGTIKYLYK